MNLKNINANTSLLDLLKMGAIINLQDLIQLSPDLKNRDIDIVAYPDDSCLRMRLGSYSLTEEGLMQCLNDRDVLDMINPDRDEEEV
jgi:hypothetical protein